MSAALGRVLMTRDEFLVWDDRQERRFEYDGFGPVAMVGGTVAHSLIKMNLYRELATRLRGTRCRAFDSDMRIAAAGSIRYPDAMVSCTPADPKATWGPQPVVVFEVCSPGTASTDLVAKNSEYHATASIQRYVVLDQNRPWATAFARDGERWLGQLIEGIDAAIELPEIGIALALADLYEGVAFGPPPLPQ